MPDAGVTPALVVAQLIGHFFRAHAAAEPAGGFVVFIFVDRFQPLRRESSRPTGDTLLRPPPDDCLCPGVDTLDAVGRCEPFPGSEYPSSLPACATVRLVLLAGPSGASDWVGSQVLYHITGGIIYLCISHSLGRPFRSDESPI